MIEVGAFEAKNKLSALLDRVEQGEEIIITRHGRPVARLVPSTEGIDRSQVQAALQRMRDRAAQAGLGPLDWETLKADRDASRP
jgi:prevent-host-death family protein